MSGDEGSPDELIFNFKREKNINSEEKEKTIFFINSFRDDKKVLYEKNVNAKINFYKLIIKTFRLGAKYIKNTIDM